MRRLASTFAVFASVLLGAQPAGAGGPTTVVLANAELGQTASYFTGDAGYQQLMDLVDGATLKAEGIRDIGPTVVATWLIHNRSVWRVDSISIVGSDVLVQTQLEPDSGSAVRRLSNAGAAQLIELLRGADLLTANQGQAVTAAAAVATEPVVPAPPVSGLWWAAGGLLAGLLLATVSGPLSRALRPRLREMRAALPGRIELIDEPYEDVTAKRS